MTIPRTFSLLLATTVLWACGAEQPPYQSVLQTSAAQPTVRLMHAVATTWCPPNASCYGSNKGYAHGFIEVANLAYHKQVVVHYNVRQTSHWQDTVASYLGPAKNNREIWRFETPRVSYPPRLSAGFQFAIRYQAAGQTHWDNNHGRDYQVGDGPRPIWPRMALNGSTLALNWAEAQGNSFRGDVVLKDLAYHKQLQVHYSTDDWATVKIASASYFNQFCGALQCGSRARLQHWGWNVTIPSGVKQIKFAIAYTVNGQTHWDNNFQSNYTVQVPGKINKP